MVFGRLVVYGLAVCCIAGFVMHQQLFYPHNQPFTLQETSLFLGDEAHLMDTMALSWRDKQSLRKDAGESALPGVSLKSHNRLISVLKQAKTPAKFSMLASPTASVKLTPRSAKPIPAAVSKVSKADADSLVKFAKDLAQEIVRREAVRQMKNWLTTHVKKSIQSAKPISHPSPVKVVQPAPARVVPHPAAASRAALQSVNDRITRDIASAHLPPSTAARLQADLSALVSARPATVTSRAPARPAPPSASAEIRSSFKTWQQRRVAKYLREHRLYTARDFCNTEADKLALSSPQLRAAFGGDVYQEFKEVNPVAASVAAVSTCLKTLGVDSRALQQLHAAAADQAAALGGGALDAGLLRRCAADDAAACAALARDRGAMAALRRIVSSSS